MTREIAVSPVDMDEVAVDARLVRNLDAFERHAPRLHARLSHIGETATELMVLDGTAVDIGFGGGSLYGGDAVRFTAGRLREFFERPERVYLSMRNTDQMVGIAGTFTSWATRYGEDADVAANRLGRNAHFAFVFGVGLGLHLDPLVRYSECRDLVLVEPSLEHLYHSLFVSEWAPVFEAVAARGGSVHFVQERDVEAISTRIRDIVRASGTPFLDGAYVHQHYKTGLLNRAYRQFYDDFRLHLYGLGFYEDELVMMSNAVVNLGRRTSKVIASPLARRDTPVFICGSGPSLDADIDFIHANRDKVILVSLGSCLRVLRRHGFEPDYHVELENEEVNAHNVQRVNEEFGIPDTTTLIASTSVRAETTAEFRDVVYYFRDRVSSTILFRAGADALGACGPSVANAALITLLYMGFRNLFLFGVDMGTRERDVYHSSETYIGIGATPEWSSAKRFAVPANFGGTAFTEGILNWSRFTFENVVRLHPDISCINCSDGVRIAHTTPQLSRLVELPGGAIDRAGVKAKVSEGLRDYSPDVCRALWDRDALSEHARDLFDRIDSLMASVEAAGSLDWMQDLYDLTNYETVDEPPTRAFLFGTTVLMLGGFNWIDGRIADPAVRDVYRAAAVEELASAYRWMRARYERMLDDVDGYLAGARDDLYVTQSDAA
ncbi:MAG: motility associated factor glycosyltransferase family protein [Alphaproteobacteria bacterium]|nr:motility associated factor glycosyltransferase family protein [Alphaproteobacteria bacterium]